MRLILLAILLLPAPGRADGGPAPAWGRVRDDDGITVHAREVVGSPLAEFRGRGVVRAPPARVYAVIRDGSRRTEWMDRCVESAVVAQHADRQLLYNRTRAIWPIADRDVVLEGRVTFDPAAGTLRVGFESIDDPAVLPKEGVVRMPFLRGHWLLRPVDGGRATHVEYQVHANPGGFLPTWAANHVARNLPFETLRRLREQVTRAAYPEVEAKLEAREEYRRLVVVPAAE